MIETEGRETDRQRHRVKLCLAALVEHYSLFVPILMTRITADLRKVKTTAVFLSDFRSDRAQTLICIVA